MATKRRKIAARPTRFTPEIIGALAEDVRGIELGEILRIGPKETLMAVCPPLARAALAMPRQELEQFLAAGAPFPENFKLRDHHIANLERWAAERFKKPAGASGEPQDGRWSFPGTDTGYRG
jgi:hypothetical protein